MNIFNNYDLHYRFLARFEDKKFHNMEYIHPLKQLDIYYILEAWKKDDNIRRVVVFGSTVSDRCHSGSDIDLYVQLDDNTHVPRLPYEQIISEVDLLVQVKETDAIWNAIMRDGIVVYERGKEYV